MPDPNEEDVHRLSAQRTASVLCSSAVFLLATGLGTLHDRVFEAYRQQAIHPSDLIAALPHEFAERVSALLDSITSAPGLKGEAPLADIRVTLESMNDDQLTKIARNICFLADGLGFAVATADRESPRTTGRCPMVRTHEASPSVALQQVQSSKCPVPCFDLTHSGGTSPRCGHPRDL
jgi:hypothetical protein